MAVTYEPIASATLGGASGSVTFSDIPGTFTDLRLIVTGSSSSGASNIGVRLNGDTSSIYSRTYLFSDSGGAASSRNTGQTAMEVWYSNSANERFVGILDLMSYANTSVFKTGLASGSATTLLIKYACLWRSTAAVSSLTIFSNAGGSTFASGSTFSLYGIKAA